MNFKVVTVSNDSYELICASSVVINKEIGIPCDDLIAIFPNYYDLPEIKTISAFIDGELVFEGIVDEQCVKCSNNGYFLKIVARSFGAYLTDNEAMPQTYYKPSLQTIFERHIQPYGFTNLIGNKRTFAGQFAVDKGMSEWDVLESFCNSFLGTSPKVTNGKTIDASGKLSEKEVVIIQNTDNALMYSSIESNLKRYSLISEVFVRANIGGEYNIRVYDQESISRDIIRRRYLNAANDTQTPASYGQKLIDNGKLDSFLIKAVCVNPIPLEIYQRAKVYDPIVGSFENLIISKIKYSLDSSGEKVEISMIEEEN